MQSVATVDKALTLLSHFSIRNPEIGLSEMAQLCGYDKATAHRLLTALERHHFVEQLSDNKKYRLGAALLPLARIREETTPVERLAKPVLRRLAQETGETAHMSLAIGNDLVTIAISESPRANRVTLNIAERLPKHATASGYAYLAFAAPAASQAADDENLTAYTKMTPRSGKDIMARIETARAQGFSEADQSYEIDVYGIAMPIFDAAGLACGTLAVATPTSRMTPEVRAVTLRLLRTAVYEITAAMGGAVNAGWSGKSCDDVLG